MAITLYLSLVFLVLYLAGLAVHRWIFLRDRRRMRDESRDGGRVIARADELQPGAVKKFWLICQKYRLDAFLVNHQGNYYAYVNRCRHMPTPLISCAMSFSATMAASCNATLMVRFMNSLPVYASLGRARANRSTDCRYASTAAMS